ncbi:MAG: ABC transporter permease, partial [Burkholderiaceae bacterium]|nr:ABC transporter permease [Burkholderiaceae bacterium]
MSSTPIEAPAATARPAARREPLLRPLVPVAPATRVALGVAFFALFVGVWAAVTFSGWVPKTFLADPLSMLASGWRLLVEFNFAHDIGMTVWRVVGGFAIAAA